MNFRNDINALRAFSIIFVVLYHFKIPFFNGGFIGVDVFFVISGYLMTMLILSRIERHSFRLIDFYIDRAFRIIPALTLVCVSYLVLGYFLLYILEYKQLAKEIVAAISFSSNILYFEQSGYFDPSAEKLYLLHAWSLAVEWQFYILYPILIICFAKVFKLQHIKYILVVICVASFLCAVILSHSAPTFAFYMLPTRAWEMLVGGLIFLFPFAITEKKRKYFQYSALLVLFASVPLLDSKMAWPGVLALLPVLSACLFIIANSQETFVSKSATLSFLGKSSYSIYLWHWPIYILLANRGLSHRTIFVIAGIIASIVVGYLSYRFIETYFVTFKKQNMLNRKKIASVLFFLVAVIIPSSFIYIYKGSEKTQFLAHYEDLHKNGLSAAYRLECDFYDNSTQKVRQSIAKQCTSVDKLPTTKTNSAFLWGDSHAQALSLGLRTALPYNYELYQVATSGCPPSLTISPRSGAIDNNCKHSNSFALSEIARLKPDIVFLAQSAFHEEVDWMAIAENLKKRGVQHVILIGPVPQFKPSLPEIYVKYGWNTGSSYLSKGLDLSILNTDRLLAHKYTSPVNNHQLLSYVPLISSLCIQERCKVVMDGTKNSLLLVDYGHLSPLGSQLVGNIIIKKITPILTVTHDTY